MMMKIPKKKILNEFETPDDNVSLDALEKLIDETVSRQKTKLVKDVTESGIDLIDEMENRRVREEKKKNKMIEYILENDKKNNYKYEDLITYTYKDIFELYKETKHIKRPILKKIFDLFTK